MIETHFHCLPGLDDGPTAWESAVQLCRAAEADGVDTIVATPHVLREPWINDDPESIRRLVHELNERVGGNPRILVGCEVFYCADLPDLMNEPGGPVISLNDGPHVLIEFPAGTVPPSAEGAFHELVVAGFVPVIAHPERNVVFHADPDRLKRFVDLGAKTQVTAGSFEGEFGRRAKAAADLLVDLDLVTLISSDAHSLDRRPPRLTAARRIVTQKWGEQAAIRLFDLGPGELVLPRSVPAGAAR